MFKALHSIFFLVSIPIFNIFFLYVNAVSTPLKAKELKFIEYDSKNAQVAENSNRSQSSWWRRLVEKRDREVSRDGAINREFCSIVPDDYGIGLMWTERPLFVFINFQGNIRRIEIYPSDSLEPIWDRDVSQAQQVAQNISIISYDGEDPLNEEEIYYYSIRTTDDNSYPLPNELIPIRLIQTDTRLQIQSDLDIIRQEASSETSEEIVEAYIEYFISNPYDVVSGEGGLFLDAVQQIFALPNSLQEVYLQDLVEVYCDLER